MRAVRIHEYGDASVIRIDDIARPEPGPGQVLLQVAATSFNPTEVALRSGVLRHLAPQVLPMTLGWDVAGTIVQLGADVRTHAIGDRVVGMIAAAAADFAVADATAVVTAPTTIPLADAAALPLAGLTAWQAIQSAELRVGERILVNGAGGGIGGFAVQLAKHAGTHVIATASPRSTEAVRRQGADQIIDYTTTAVDSQVDVVLNLVPLDDEHTLGTLARRRIVSATTMIAAPPAVTTTHIVARNDPADLATLVSLVDRGVLTVDVAERRAFDELAIIHRRSEKGDVRGKIVVPAALERPYDAQP